MRFCGSSEPCKGINSGLEVALGRRSTRRLIHRFWNGAESREWLKVKSSACVVVINASVYTQRFMRMDGNSFFFFLYFIVEVVTLLLNLFGNSSIIYVMLFRGKVTRSTNYFILSVAISSLLVALTSSPFAMIRVRKLYDLVIDKSSFKLVSSEVFQ